MKNIVLIILAVVLFGCADEARIEKGVCKIDSTTFKSYKTKGGELLFSGIYKVEDPAKLCDAMSAIMDVHFYNSLNDDAKRECDRKIKSSGVYLVESFADFIVEDEDTWPPSREYEKQKAHLTRKEE